MVGDWIEKQWQGLGLGDARLTKRAIAIGKSCLENPQGNLPTKMRWWAALHAAYRFFGSPRVSHEKLQQPHNELVIEAASEPGSTVLFVQDGSELLYNKHPCTDGLGPTSDASGHGMLFHTALAVKWQRDTPSSDVLGVAKQTVWVRSARKDRKIHEEKESRVWLDTLKKLGNPPPHTRWISVGDRGSDIYEYLEGATKSGWHYVVRAKHDRAISVDGGTFKLRSWIRQQSAQAAYSVKLRSRPGKLARDAAMQLTWGRVTLLPPQGHSGCSIEATCVRAYDPTDTSLEWIIVTSLTVTNAEEALDIVRMYEQRWIIEEYHKCLKTGCGIEDAQLKTKERLLALLGILGVVAVQLLRLRALSRAQPGQAALEVIPEDIVTIVRMKFKLKGDLSLGEFWRRVAMLGGFIGRKSDGDPGWQTLWRGWLSVLAIHEGMEMAKRCV